MIIFIRFLHHHHHHHRSRGALRSSLRSIVLAAGTAVLCLLCFIISVWIIGSDHGTDVKCHTVRRRSNQTKVTCAHTHTNPEIDIKWCFRQPTH